jgi:hypothetical protein
MSSLPPIAADWGWLRSQGSFRGIVHPRSPPVTEDAQACATAGDGGVDIAGGASTVRQALAADVIDELTLDVVPVLLGSGERMFDGVDSFGFEPVEVLHSPLATHIRYRRSR